MIPRASLLIPLTLALLASGVAAQVTPGGDAAKKEYWLARSKPLAPKDPRAVRAMEIFEKTLAAADKRPGPRPELVILDEAGYPWARSRCAARSLPRRRQCAAGLHHRPRAFASRQRRLLAFFLLPRAASRRRAG
ncbi:MAG: hypothetical protein HY804_12170 [Nitrospinae bacterium]|nr:hypothetical protein [Nitrospinota bacterium]